MLRSWFMDTLEQKTRFAGTSSLKRCSKSVPLTTQPSHQQPPVIMVKNGISFLQNNLSLVKIAPTDSPVESGRPQGLVMSVDTLDVGADDGCPNSRLQFKRQGVVRSQSQQQRSIQDPMSSVQNLQTCISRTVSCSTIHPGTVSSGHRGKIHYPKNRK